MTDFTFKLWIDGAAVDAHSGTTWNLIDPATEQTVMSLPFGDGDDARAALEAAARAFPAWSKLTPYDRAPIFFKAAAWIRERITDLALITSEESGKPLRESRGEWATAAASFEWFAEEAKRAYGRIVPARRTDRRLLVTTQPLGVVGTITAWNFPVYNPVRAWSAALAAGCTVVGRPSEYTPRSALLLGQALIESGIPNGVINVINGDPAAMGAAMLADPRCRKIAFTGSTRVGKLLMDGASQTVTRLSLELGGNAPVLIFPDVDVAAIAQAAVNSKTRNNGQVCIAPQRFLVHSQIAEEFIERAAASMAKLKLGAGREEATQVGPLINAVQRDRLAHLVDESVGMGAQVITGGGRPSEFERGYFYCPTVIAGVTPDMPVYRDELFGPVMPVVAFDDADHALALANDTEYGLAAYVHTRDLNTAIRIYEGLEFGIVGVNDWMPTTPEMPFGGMKASGLGREYGSEGLHEYMEIKSVFIGGI
ncbi:MAG: NAD-dependent succinate-semialdehyde dehydrogenase [Chloroflexota bacterium]|nr:NAD-dependent succinate-semialdehyde dehydrogenase [Chloroflexota bacterium]